MRSSSIHAVGNFPALATKRHSLDQLAFALFAVSFALAAPAQQAPASRPVAGQAAPPAAQGSLERKRLALREAASEASFAFIPNRGQAAAGDLFVAHGAGASMLLRADGLEIDVPHRLAATATAAPEASPAGQFELSRPASLQEPSRVSLRFANANPGVRVEGLEPAAARVNYLHGNDPTQWQTNLPSYGRVRYSGLYRGIDLTYYGQRDRHLEYDLVVAPGADPGQIELDIAGDKGASLDEAGNLHLDGPNGDVSLMRPILYQNMDHGKRMIQGSFVKLANGRFGFAHAEYDRTRPLIIDPTINIVYASFAGGLHNDEAFDMTLDAAGNAYLAGWSASEDFPVSANGLQQTRANLGSYLYDAVVLKFDASGTLIFSTFLGGSQNEQGEGIRVDTTGQVYLTGYTQSSDFPVTANALQKSYGGGSDAFFAVIANDGSRLVYSTYLGGSGDENAARMIADPNGGFWLAGVASAAGLPATAGAYQSAPNSTDNGFIAKVVYTPANAQPLAITALTFLGGSSKNGEEIGIGDIALDATGNVYVTGASNSMDYPVTANAYAKSSAYTLDTGCYNSSSPNELVTVSELSADLKTLIYSTALGGKVEDQNGYPVCNQFGRKIHPDNKGNIWIVGTTGMSDFPTSTNALSKTLNGNGSAGVDAFITELTPGAQTTALTYSSYIGGSQFDYGASAAWDASGDIWIAATTQSPDWPGIVQGTSLQAALAGGYDIGLVELQPDGTKILYSTYLGGSNDEDAASGRVSIALDANNGVHLAGGTGSGNFPVTPNAFQTKFANGDSGPDGYDLYYAVLGAGTIGQVTPSTGGNAGDSTITITGADIQSGATCSLIQSGVTILATSAVVNAAGTSITCTFPLTGATVGAYAVAVTNPNGTSFTQTSAFTVQSGGGANFWMNVIGRAAIRVGTPTTFYVPYGNSGNSNAYGVTVLISFPLDATITQGFTIQSVTTVPGVPKADYTGETAIQIVNGQQVLALYLPFVPAGSSSALQFTLSAPKVESEEVSVQYLAPLASSLTGFAQIKPAFDPGSLELHPDDGLPQGSQQAYACFTSILGAAATVISGTNPITGSVKCGESAIAFATSIANTGVTLDTNTNATSGVFSAGGVITAGAITALNCAGVVSPAAGVVAGVVSAIVSGGSIATNCGGYFRQAWDTLVKGALDPNDKGGTSGDRSTSHFVNGKDAFPYLISFENQPTATLPSARVVVTDQLDPTKVNLATLTLGPIAFSGQTFLPPAGATSYTTTYVPTKTSSYVVRVQASVNTSTGLLTWTFQTIDPTTGQPPTDPTVGFLPPDSNGIVGAGSVVYSVQPKAGLTTGTAVPNVANVVFDANAAIATPTWLLTLDVDPPVSHVTALPATVTPAGATTPFTVNWSGTDAGSGVASYTIYVSDNGGAFTVFQSAVSTTSAVYTGQTGHTYGFYSIAMDGALNVEAAKTAAETTTLVAVPAVATMTALTSSTAAAVPGAPVTFTATVTPASGTVIPTGTVTFSNGATVLGMVSLNGGVASLVTSTLPTGTDSITAAYGVTSGFAASVSPAVTVVIATPGFTLSATPATLSIAPGQSGAANLTLTTTGGFNQQVGLACSGLPAYTRCQFSPATLTPTGNGAFTSTLTLTTNVATASLNLPAKPLTGSGSSTTFAALILFGLGGILTRRRQAYRLGILRAVSLWRLSPILLLLGLLAASGCSSAPVGTPQTVTPAGSSTVVVTATGGSLSATANVTLTIP